MKTPSKLMLALLTKYVSLQDLDVLFHMAQTYGPVTPREVTHTDGYRALPLTDEAIDNAMRMQDPLSPIPWMWEGIRRDYMQEGWEGSGR